MRSFPIAMVAAGCVLSLLACADDRDTGRSDAGGAGGGGAMAGRGGGPGGSASGGAGTTTGGAGTTGTGGRGGSGGGGGSSGGSSGGAWDCLDVPGTLCICYARAGTDAPTCSAGFTCCFLLNATSCECFVNQEDCTSAATQYAQVASCPPP